MTISRSQRVSIAIWFCLFFSWALLQCCAYKTFEFYGDTLSYLDLAEAWSKGNFTSGFSAYWNPLYPLLIALCFKIHRPESAALFSFLKVLNLFVFVCLFGSFELFLCAFQRFYVRRASISQPVIVHTKRSVSLFAHLLFAFCFFYLDNVSIDTPDMIASTFSFLAVAVLTRIADGATSYKNYCIFGALSGLVYLAKNAAVLPIFVALFCFALGNMKSKGTFTKCVAALFTTALVSAPYVIVLDSHIGHFSLSESGKINYLWSVQECDMSVNILPSRSLRKELDHPTNVLSVQPPVFEFSQPFTNATYPPWFDPSYWLSGCKIVASPLILKQLLINVVCNSIFYLREFFLAIGVTLIVVRLAHKNPLFSSSALIRNAILLAPSGVAFASYMVATNLLAGLPAFNLRYFAFPMFMLLLGLFASLRLHSGKNGRRALKSLATMSGALFLLAFAIQGCADWNRFVHRDDFPHLQVVDGLHRLGIRSGSTFVLACGGEPLWDWARLGDFHITAEIHDAPEWFALEPAKRRGIMESLKKHGAQNILAFVAPVSHAGRIFRNFNKLPGVKRMLQPYSEPAPIAVPSPPADENWQQVGNLPCWVLRL